jgi:hypothetical protein
MKLKMMRKLQRKLRIVQLEEQNPIIRRRNQQPFYSKSVEPYRLYEMPKLKTKRLFCSSVVAIVPLFASSHSTWFYFFHMKGELCTSAERGFAGALGFQILERGI